MLIIVMGVSGSGKSTIAKLLADKTGLDYYDADDFHPQSNIDKMKGGKALNDTDRKPWLLLLAKKLYEWEQQKGAILACSALKESYRELLSSQSKKIKWVYLTGTFETIKNRIESRKGHFMDTHLLQSQFDTLEPPTYGVHVAIDQTPQQITTQILSRIQKNLKC
ncbi:gluconokinase [Aquimarina agarilytica]|uniref:gluconokinase n=1 Tax=Aquimarina agarilytica TaxID=1087449 RepID=UPI00031D2E85|nr:gluconokinase [Aquimarina agarilytica]